MALWGGFSKQAPWRNPYFREKRQRRFSYKTGLICLVGLAGVMAMLWSRSTFIRAVRIDGAATEESRTRTERALEQELDRARCAWFFSCRHALLLRESRLRTWMANAAPRMVFTTWESKSEVLTITVQEPPSAFTVLVGEEAWLLDAQGLPVQTLSAVERVRKAVEDPENKGIQWQDHRTEARSLEERQEAWKQLALLWSQAQRIHCQSTQAFLEEDELVKLHVSCQGTPVMLYFSFRRDLDEQWSKVELFLKENLVELGKIEYIDARYHQRLFYK